MKKMIDLSGKLENGLWGYHELPSLENIIPHVIIKTVATIKKDGFFASKIEVSSISGTYLESGSHMLQNGKDLDAYTIEDFIKPVKVLRLPEQKKKSLIKRELLEKYSPDIKKGEALIIGTGWGRMWNKPGYVLECPNYLRDAMEWILEKDISILGVDVPCIEASWSENDKEEKGSLLSELFKRGTLLVAPLVNIENITKSSGTIYCLPMNVKGSSGAPARVVFIEEV